MPCGERQPDLLRMPCACANLRRAARAVTQLYDAALRKGGLRSTQFTLLSVLTGMGEMTQGRLAEALAMDSTTLTRTLALLHREGWIEVRPGDDRRQRRIRITPKGTRRLEQAMPRWSAIQARLKAALGGRWRETMRAVDRLAGAAQHLGD
jgi:DNA-binding MarR family transcriptional regulator